MKNVKITWGLLLVFLFTSSFIRAQFTLCKAADIATLKASGVVTVALSDDDESNKIVEEIMKNCWTASKFNVIKRSDLAAFVKANPDNYVLTYLLNNATLTIDKSSIGRNTTTGNLEYKNKNGSVISRTIGDGLALVKGVKKVKKLEPKDAMIYCFIDSKLEEVSPTAELMRQVGAMNSILVFPNISDKQLGGYKVATLDQKEVVTKELWVVSDYLNEKGGDEASIKANYNPHKFKIVTYEDIAKAIIEKRKDIVYMAHLEYIVGGYMFTVHCPDNNRTLFFMAGTNGLDGKDFLKIKTNKQYGQ